jgi:hypothetical protein
MIPASCAATRLCLTLQSSKVHPLCMAFRTRSVLSHPPNVKPQRTSTLKSNTLLQMPNIDTFIAYKRTHTYIHITQNIMQEKLLCYINNGKCMFVQRFYRALSGSSQLYPPLSTPLTTK